MDKSGIQLSVEDGQHAEAGELFEMVMEEMKFPAVAREVFSLWLVSDLLGECHINNIGSGSDEGEGNTGRDLINF